MSVGKEQTGDMGRTFRPDFIVRDADLPRFRVVVEVKGGRSDPNRAARQLHEYMRAYACPLGLLVTPRETHLYEESYLDEPESIRESLVVDTVALLESQGVIERERDLEDAVQQWLEGVARRMQVRPRPSDERVAQVEQRLLPALVGGEVATAAP
jgi:hypothetical protein